MTDMRETQFLSHILTDTLQHNLTAATYKRHGLIQTQAFYETQ